MKNDAFLLQKLEALEKRLDAVLNENAQLKQENKLLREKVDLLVRRAFAPKSESSSHPEFEMEISKVLSLTEFPLPSKKKEPKPSQIRRKRLAKDLPVEVEIIDPAPVLENPEAFRQIGEEVTDQYDYQPGRFFNRRLIRRKFVSKIDSKNPPIIAPLPALLQERCEAAPGLIASVIVGKYVDHLPLYRQEQIFLTRHGMEISRQNMARWMGLAADWLKPLYQDLAHEIFQGGYVQCDETPIRYLSPGNGKTKLGYLWTVRDPRPGGEVFYRWEVTRASSALDELIPKAFKGILQVDGYSAYDTFQGRNPDRIKLSACWAHVRRKFFEAQMHEPKKAKRILRILRRLYRQESLWRKHLISPAQRHEHRQKHSAPWIARLFELFTKWTFEKRFLPKSSMGVAIAYALSLKSKLEVFLKDGRVEIDNNLVENAIRPTALGKKNWLFFGCEDAGERSAILYTLAQSCKLHGVNPFDYFRHVLTQIPSHTNKTVHTLTPRSYAQSLQPQVIAA